MIIPVRPKSYNKNKKVYFPKETEEAIVEYNNTEDSVLKSQIYEKKIYYSFFKLTENIINTFKFHHIDGEEIHDFQQELMTFLLSKMNLFNPKKDVNEKIGKILEDPNYTGFLEFVGDKKRITENDILEFCKNLTISKSKLSKIKEITPPKAYSYFGTIVKRYCIIATKKNYKKKIEKSPLEEIDNAFSYSHDSLETTDNNEKLSNFIDQYVNLCYNNIYNLFPNTEDSKIADAILELFQKRINIQIFNKKALYFHIREKVQGVKTPKITNVANKLFEIFKHMYSFYLENGYINFNLINIYMKKEH